MRASFKHWCVWLPLCSILAVAMVATWNVVQLMPNKLVSSLWLTLACTGWAVYGVRLDGIIAERRAARREARRQAEHLRVFGSVHDCRMSDDKLHAWFNMVDGNDICVRCGNQKYPFGLDGPKVGNP